MKNLKHMKSSNEASENLNISDVSDSEIIKCRWCGEKFKPTKKFQICCTSEHDSKYNNYVSNSSVENPWDKYTKDGYKDTYYQ